MDRKKKVGIWVYIVAVIVVVLYLMPIYVMLNQSFRELTDLTPRLYLPAVWTLDNYVQTFTSGDLFRGFLNSLIYTFEVCVLEVLFGGLAAYGIGRAGGKFAKGLRTFNIAIMMIPAFSLLVGTYSLMVKLNMVNKIWALSLQSSAVGMASTMFFYTSFVVSIPKSLDESASIDGAGILRTYFSIIFPQMKAITITRLIMVAVGTWNNYAMPTYLLTSTSKSTVVMIIRKAFYVAAGTVENVPLACAKCVIGLLPIMIMYLTCQHYIIEGQLDAVNK